MQVVKGSHQKGGKSVQRSETFVGHVMMDPIFSAEGVSANNVLFMPCARTNWHTHEKGQILIVTSGSGYVCSKGGEPVNITNGDVVHIPAGETHWHGGGKDTFMSHTAITMGCK